MRSAATFEHAEYWIPEQCTRIHRVAPLFAHTFHSKFHEFIPFILERVYLCRWHRWQRCGYPIECSIAIALHGTITVGSISTHARTYPIFVPTVCVCKLCCLFCHCAALMPAATHQWIAHRFQRSTLSSHFEVSFGYIAPFEASPSPISYS